MTTETKDPMSDLRALVEALHDDRAEQKRKEAADRWTRGVSLWVIMLAVVGALVGQQQTSFSGKAQRTLNQASIEQGQATNQWSYYQAVSVKAHLFRFQSAAGGGKKAAKEKQDKKSDTSIAEAPRAGGVASEGKPQSAAPTIAAAPAKVSKVGLAALTESKLAKYEKQKEAILTEARGFDKKRDELRSAADVEAKTSRGLGFAIALIQVAVALASTAILAKRRAIYVVSLAAGGCGVLQVANSFLGWLG